FIIENTKHCVEESLILSAISPTTLRRGEIEETNNHFVQSFHWVFLLKESPCCVLNISHLSWTKSLLPIFYLRKIVVPNFFCNLILESSNNSRSNSSFNRNYIFRSIKFKVQTLESCIAHFESQPQSSAIISV
ncbi:hypothetical protein Avbf_15906, partial [Armadillidium vulgare]